MLIYIDAIPKLRIGNFNYSLSHVLESMDSGVTGAFLAMDIRQSLHYLGEITGAITTEALLENIFGKFCIRKCKPFLDLCSG
jgi:tRNA U34 5-carboxymethylaminomethyl modifying GTPase MnmE/TrmE